MRPLPAATVMGVPGDLRALAASGLLTGRELARVPVDSWLPADPDRPRTSRSASSSPPGWAGPSSTGWSSRCSAGSTRAAPTSCRWRPPCRSSPARAAGALAARRRAGQPGGLRRRRAGRRGVRGLRGRRRPAAGRGRPGVRRRDPHRGHGPRAAPGPRPAGGWWSARPARRRRCWPTRWCSPCRPPPPRGCCARTRPRPRPSSRRCATRRWPSSRSPSRSAAFRQVPTGSGFLVPPVDGRSVKAVTFTVARSGAGTPSGAGPGASSGPRSAATGTSGAAARRRRPGRPGPGRPHRRPRGHRPRRWTPGSPGGAAGCRSTRSATGAGSRGSRRPRWRSPGSRCAARRTTASGCRPASHPGEQAAGRGAATMGQ